MENSRRIHQLEFIRKYKCSSKVQEKALSDCVSDMFVFCVVKCLVFTPFLLGLPDFRASPMSGDIYARALTAQF